MKLPLEKIRLDGGTQTRARIQEDVIEEYAEDMASGSPFPPLVVFHDGRDYWLGDGFHRWGAAMKLKLASIECEIRQGTLADAQWFSFSANRSNGMRRTNDDKVRAAKSALRHSAARPDVEIARHVGVSNTMVAKYRAELEAAGEIARDAHLSTVERCADDGTAGEAAPGEPARVVTRKGKTYQMKVGQIGKAKKPNRRKPGQIAKDAYQPTRSTAQPSEMLSVSLPVDNPHMAARGMLSRYQREFLVALVKELTLLLKEGAVE
ncbi:MAG: ParB N-terminal domain-containing protein [Planctomycetes bacterium]|nr:ParB N-terminal domain-containing protein [Planctomycetota bacterium]